MRIHLYLLLQKHLLHQNKAPKRNSTRNPKQQIIQKKKQLNDTLFTATATKINNLVQNGDIDLKKEPFTRRRKNNDYANISL